MNSSEFKPGVAYELPVPESIEGGFSNPRVRCLCENGEWHSWEQRKELGYTHWCLLPEIPKPKSQAELDGEWARAKVTQLHGHNGMDEMAVFSGPDVYRLIAEAIVYARTP